MTMEAVAGSDVGGDVGDFYEGLKTCNKCNEEKPLSEFYTHKTNSDGVTGACKICTLAYRRAKYENRKNVEKSELAKMDRVERFVKGFLETSELADDELSGRFIRDDSGKPHHIAQLESLSRPGNRFVAKLNKELSLRLNEYIKSKSMRAVQVVFEIADSDACEPSDRFKAATWLAERVIGKTPDVLLTGDVTKVYEDIFEPQIESGSREDYRKRIESVRGEAVEQLALEAEIVEDEQRKEFSYEEDDLEATSQTVGYGSEDGDSGSSGISLSSDDGERSSLSPVLSDSSEDTGITVVGEARAEKRAEIERFKKARQKAKQRRFAARAVGATSLEKLPYLLEFQLIKTGVLAGKLTCRLVCPGDLTEARWAKLVEINELTDSALEILYPQVDEEISEDSGTPELNEGE